MELLIYLLKVSACMAMFFAFYLLVPRKLTFFKLNRFYLLGGLLLSFAIPASQLTIEKEVPQQINNIDLPMLTHTPVMPTSAMPIVTGTMSVEDSFNWYLLLPYLYGAIVLCLLLVTTWKLLQLFKHTRVEAAKINGLRLVPKSMGFTNCSFFNYVFIDQQRLSAAELEVLLTHEEVHAKQLHSIDKILMMLTKAVLWFNPIVYLYDKALEEAHEYEADETTSNNFGTGPYASLLLKLAVEKNAMPLVHNFVKSPIKQRIKMLFNGKSSTAKKLAYLFVLPIGLGLIWGFTIKVVEVNPKTQLYSDKNLNIDSVSIYKDVVKSTKRIAFLTPSVISTESTFITEDGNINHYKGAKIELFNGLLSAKEVVLNNKLNTMVALNASYVFNNGYETKGDTIEFDLKTGTSTVKNAPKPLSENKPKLISSESVRVDVKADISYIKQGKIEIGEDKLEAEEIAWDARNGLLTAKTATLKLANGKVVSDQYIIYDIKKRSYVTNSTPDNKIHVKSAAYQLLSKLTLTNDSIRVVSTMDVVAIRADAKINIDGYKLKGNLITCKENSNVLTAHHASLTDRNGKVINAEELQFDILTKAYKIIKP